ncbi:MAG: amidohydrolase family protein [Deltaproteobacteria bacterium]|nr:amidohydrolase family protein [Deltaproteobacteria bacterium]
MFREEMTLEDILKIEVDEDRIQRLRKLVKFDIPGINEEVERFLIRQQIQFVNIQYARFLAGVTFTESDVDALVRNAVDCHAHGGSDPFDRLMLEDEIAFDYSKAGMRAVVFKTWFTPSASRIQLVQKYLDKWAEENDIQPVKIFGGITLNKSVGGINPDAVRRCLGFPGFKYVWMPMVDSYHHRRVVFDDWSEEGLRLLDENGKVLPELTEVLRIAADNDLVVATGHFPYDPDHKAMLEQAKRLGVKRLEIIHPAHIHCKTSIAQMKEAASEGVKLMLSGLGTTTFPLHETGPVYAVRMIKEVGADHIVYGSDYGQVHNPPHVVGIRWVVKLLLSYGATSEEVRKVLQQTPARHLGLDGSR